MKIFTCRNFLLSSIALFSLIHIGIATPPNPYNFYQYNPGHDQFLPRSDQSHSEFQHALQGCCDTRRTGVLQADGTEYVLGIKIDFPDQPGQRSNTDFDRYLFSDDGISLKTYYREVSYGKMNIESGPMEGVVPKGNQWVRAKKKMGYYGQGKINKNLYLELLVEACQGVDPFVDFSEYDRNDDGIVDHVFLIHAGDDEASTSTGTFGDNIWSILLRPVNRRFDGVLVESAIVVAEEPSFDHPHLGIYFHEFFHDFGAPDVYGSTMVDQRDHKWGLMGMFGPYQGDLVNGLGNGLNPSHIIGYLKWDFDANPDNGQLGWLEPITLKKNTPRLEVPNFELNDVMFKIDTSSKDEYFLIENRFRQSGAIYDRRLPESGILIWHVDETQVRPSYSIDAAGQIWLEDPNDPDHQDYQHITVGAAFSTDDNETSFTPSTKPSSSTEDGSATGISITNISQEGQIMTLDVWFGDTYEPNNNLSSAHKIELDQSYESFISATDDVDFYRIDVAGPKFIIIELSNIPDSLDYQLSLRNEEGFEIKQGERTGDTKLIGYRTKSERKIYVVVRPKHGFDQFNSYRLRVSNAESIPNSLVLDNVRVYPNPVYGLDRITFNYVIPSRNLQFAEKVDLEIYTIDKSLVYTDEHRDVIGSNRFEVSVNQFANGIYVYMIQVQKRAELVQKFGKFAVAR